MPYSTDDLKGKTILVAEDEYMLADAIDGAIRSAGGAVYGPFPAVAEALDALRTAVPQPDAGVLNIRLQDGESYPVADELARLGVPFVFASANSASSLPNRFSRRAMVPKPYAPREVVHALIALLSEGPPGPS